ncbi:MAG TPA: LytTR family DNA-binding domain-containing protein, partial [Chitinophagaceae bacterium]|nr:LytTR family DNA-binding domain-containing protein [Chitinophagaceae bacterium]
ALEAVNQQVQGYLLKPVVITEFVAIVQKVKARLEKAKQNELERLQGDQVKMLAVMARDQIELLQIDDIMRMEAKGSYTTIHCANGNIHLSSKKLKEYEDRLPSSQFLRVHHSHIVNLKFVQKMLRTRNGNLIMNDQTEIPISPNKKKEVSERIIM